MQTACLEHIMLLNQCHSPERWSESSHAQQRGTHPAEITAWQHCGGQALRGALHICGDLCRGFLRQENRSADACTMRNSEKPSRPAQFEHLQPLTRQAIEAHSNKLVNINKDRQRS